MTDNEPATVRCETDLGDVLAFWRGGVLPQVGTVQHVEVDAVGPLAWADGPEIVDPRGASEHQQLLRGVVEDVEGDAVTVRVGTAVLLLEVQGDPPLGVVGSPEAGWFETNEAGLHISLAE